MIMNIFRFDMLEIDVNSATQMKIRKNIPTFLSYDFNLVSFYQFITLANYEHIREN